MKKYTLILSFQAGMENFYLKDNGVTIATTVYPIPEELKRIAKHKNVELYRLDFDNCKRFTYFTKHDMLFAFNEGSNTEGLSDTDKEIKLNDFIKEINKREWLVEVETEQQLVYDTEFSDSQVLGGYTKRFKEVFKLDKNKCLLLK